MRRKTVLSLLVLLMSSGLAGCDDEIVYRDRPIFDEPIAAAMGFLGYSDEDDKLTVCGNCHVGQQNEWEETQHASAFATLEAPGVAANVQDFCRACHSVNSLGNPVEGDQGGWLAAKETRYHDVQCESCHGPGLTHVRNPDGSQPLAPVAVGADLTQGCGECHSGAHHPFVEEWEQSPHAIINPYPAGRTGCDACHSGEGALRAWGVKAEYLEKERVLNTPNEHLAITCAVCHDPHSNEFEGQLRFPVQNTSIESHLCAQCHNRRTVPDPGSSHGLSPHAPEAALLVGDAGHFFPGTNVGQGQILGTHGSEANPGLCTTCHVSSFEVTDQSGNFVVTATGHTFNAIPCVDAQGIPQPGTVDCPVTPQARSFQGCTGSGCHGSAQAAASAMRTSALRTNELAHELERLLRQVDPNLEGAGGAIDPGNPVFTVAEGAFFNMELAQFGGNIEGAGGTITTWGSTAHNPFLVESLLITSIQEVRRAYGIAASSISLQSQLKAPPAGHFAKSK